MGVKQYNKLVRDKIPDIITAAGQQPSYRILEDQDYLAALIQKLHEEVAEFNEDQSIEELADILEVVFALANQIGTNEEKLAQQRLKKQAERGGFDQKIYLEKVEGV